LNLLITGGDGFLAKECWDYFSANPLYNVIVTNRSNLDILKPQAVKNFFKKHTIDIVIHTAVSGGKRTSKDTIETLHHNILMYHNLIDNLPRISKMFMFGSGAEFDRSQNIENIREEEIFNRYPKDYYGLSKNLISRHSINLPNVINLRLFGCFGFHDEPQRLIRTVDFKIKQNKKIIMDSNHLMDFIYAPDVCRIIEYYLEDSDLSLPSDINLCYKEKKTINEIIFLIKNLTSSNNDVILKNKDLLSYTGDSCKLDNLSVSLIGLEKGVEECLKRWKRF